MAIHLPRLLFTTLCLSILLLLLLDFDKIRSMMAATRNNKPVFLLVPWKPSRIIPPLSPATINRKVMASYLSGRQRGQSQDIPPDRGRQTKPSVGEVDPRYGVEKRLVPTGPNPLHH
ncbi:hypothetical protein MLD38_037993 [Melastoma candidum]|uniref:Uncharacterized protein n=1 Tax=Melastoma candidum TaxID=119954 RepID=A0ACB9KXM4_9MYRT|nr:hypothetical protein MLD38_037993 [Melastoma candidum]